MLEISLGCSLSRLPSGTSPLVSGGHGAGQRDGRGKRRLDANKERDSIWQMFSDRLWLAGGSVSRAEAHTVGAQGRDVCTAGVSFPMGFPSHSLHNAYTWAKRPIFTKGNWNGITMSYAYHLMNICGCDLKRRTINSLPKFPTDLKNVLCMYRQTLYPAPHIWYKHYNHTL